LASQEADSSQFPEMSVKKMGHYYEVFFSGFRVTVGRREWQYLVKMAEIGTYVSIFDQSVFGYITRAYVRYHVKRMYEMERKGLVQIEPNDGHSSVILTPLGVQVVKVLKQAK